MGKGSRVSLKNRRFSESRGEAFMHLSVDYLEEGKNSPHLNGGCTCTRKIPRTL